MKSPLLTPFRLLILLVLTGWTAVVFFPGILLRLGLPLPEHWFLDSYAVLAANDAVRNGGDVLTANALDPLNRPHVYSNWWLGLRWLGLDRGDNFLVGATWGVVFFIVAFASLRPATPRATLWLAAVLLAPPFLLAVQRANNDLVIFALVGLGVLAWRRFPQAGPAWLGAAAVLATGLKYYPVTAALVLLVVPRWTRGTLFAFGITAALALGVLFVERDAVVRGTFAIPPTIHQFGAGILWRGSGLGDREILLAGLTTLTVAAVGLAFRGTTTGLADDARGPEMERALFAVGACLLLGCFLAATSFAYRWIFSLWLWPWTWREAKAGRGAARLALGLWLIGIWSDGALCLVVNSAGLDYHPGPGWRGLTQLPVWSLMALLSGWLLDGLVVRGREWWRTRRRETAAA